MLQHMRTVVKVPEVSDAGCMRRIIGIEGSLGRQSEGCDLGFGLWDAAPYGCFCRSKGDHIRLGCGGLEDCRSYDWTRRGTLSMS